MVSTHPDNLNRDTDNITEYTCVNAQDLRHNASLNDDNAACLSIVFFPNLYCPFSFFDVVVCKVKLGYIKNNCNISKWAYKLTKKLKQNKKLNTSLHIQFDLASLTTLD